MAEAQATPYSARTAWARSLAAPVRDFLGTETGSAIVLLGAALAALVWANSPWRDSDLRRHAQALGSSAQADLPNGVHSRSGVESVHDVG